MNMKHLSICVFFNLSSTSYSFLCTDLSPSWLNLCLGILLFLMQLYRRLFFKFLFVIVHYFFFSFLIALAGTSSTMLNRSGKSGYPYLVLHLKRKSFQPFTVEYDVSWGGCHIWPLLCWDMFLLYTLLKVFVMNEYSILSKAFSASIEMIIWFFSFNLLIWCITLIDLCILKKPCIPGMNPT